jgi:hypothetical protein
MMLLRRVLTRFTEHREDFRWPLTDGLEAGQELAAATRMI